MPCGDFTQWAQLIDMMHPKYGNLCHVTEAMLQECGLSSDALADLPDKTLHIRIYHGHPVFIMDKLKLVNWVLENLPRPEVRGHWFKNMTKEMGRDS